MTQPAVIAQWRSPVYTNASDPSMRHQIAVLLSSMLAIAFSGCSSSMYQASTLPQHYRAPRHVSARHIDLSRMPRSAIPAEWLQPGDAVQVTIATGVEEGQVPQWDVDIDASGNVDVPLVGRVPVGGLTPHVAAQRIHQEAIRRGAFVDPKVSLRIVKKRSFRVSVVGAVNKPNNYDLPVASSDLLTALGMAEGLSLDADTTVEIRHTPAALEAMTANPPILDAGGEVALVSHEKSAPKQVVHVDLENLDALDPEDLRLLDGSVVSVSRRKKRIVNVLGLVNRPSSIEMPDGEDLTLLAAVAQAGGPTLSVADKVNIVRTPPGSDKPITIEASLSDARSGGPSNLVLAHGDIVNVAETPTTFALDAIRTFFRVGFSAALPGM